MSAPVTAPVPVLPIATIAAATGPVVGAATGSLRRLAPVTVSISSRVPGTLAAFVARLGSQPGEQALVLRQDRVPAVVIVNVLLAVLSHRRSKGWVAFKELHRFDEFPAIGVEESGVAPTTVIHEDLGAGVGEHRRADRKRFECQERQTLVR